MPLGVVLKRLVSLHSCPTPTLAERLLCPTHFPHHAEMLQNGKGHLSPAHEQPKGSLTPGRLAS
jgi:hypothetical protein